MTERIGSIVIENVQPSVDAGRYAVKRIAGETARISADIFKEGHDVLTAVVRWRQVSPARSVSDWQEIPMAPQGNDLWTAEFPLIWSGRYQFYVEAWPDGYRTWATELTRKVEAGQKVQSELLEGAALLHQTATRAQAVSRYDAERLLAAEKAILAGPQEAAVVAALDPGLVETAARYPDRTVALRSEKELEIFVDRPRAQTGAWYEFFPRSALRDGTTHASFKDAERLLPEIAAMGFDVIYLPPIHPIGQTARKGKNNSLSASPEDVGSPWAIGAATGGHKAVHPKLGTLDDFKSFIASAATQGIEIAMDLAFQCSPDHPYLKEHPEWFHHRPDGTIKTAENPPKRYEDIVNFDFLGPGRETLWPELESVVQHWIDTGVKIFRVDNPHTKPLVFWEWLIRRIHDRHPEVIFLAEAFTRPKVMKSLAKLGFQQSYTYFTWRNFKQELQDYLTELTTPPVADYMRGNLWPNTPDILPEILQQGGPPAFKLRFALAATLSSVYGLYGPAYELCEGRPVKAGKEEYLDSEKYQLEAWKNRPHSIRDYMTRINRIRRENPALLQYRNLRFYRADNDNVVFYGKSTKDHGNQLLMVVSLDPYSPQETLIHLPLQELGVSPDETYQVHDLLRDERALWRGPTALVKLTPDEPAAIYRVLRFARSEQSFDYYF